VRRGKVVCRSTKVAISVKCVKIEEKILWRAYRKSPTLFRTPPTPYGLLFPKIWGLRPPPKTSIAITSGMGKASLSYRLQIWLVHSQGRSKQKPIKNSGEKGAWAYPWIAQFFGYTLLSQERVML